MGNAAQGKRPPPQGMTPSLGGEACERCRVQDQNRRDGEGEETKDHRTLLFEVGRVSHWKASAAVRYGIGRSLHAWTG